MSNEFLAVVAAAIAVLTLIGLVYRMFLKNMIHSVHDFSLWLGQFRRDWEGEAATPGRSAQPGIMERLNEIDGQFQRNGGHSLRDKVEKLLEETGKLDQRVDTMEIKQEEIWACVNKD